MRKIFLLALLAACVIAFAACNNAVILDDVDGYPQSDDVISLTTEEYQELTLPDVPIHVAFAVDDFLAIFDYVHELDYNFVRVTLSEPGALWQPHDTRLVFWPSQHITDFAVIFVGNDMLGNDVVFIPIASYGHISVLSQGEAFVINNYIGTGTMPQSGITFVDEGGATRYFTFQQSVCGNDLILREFENRVDELPDGWQSYWELPTTISEPEPNPEFRAILLAESGISEYGWQVAADFLSDFTSIFTDVHHAEIIWDDDLGIGIDSTPWAYVQRFEDIDWYGEPGVSYTFHYANYFKLFDFDGNGIPDIFVHFQQTFEGCYGGFYRIFRYIDGEYHMMEMAAFRNSQQQEWVNFGATHQLFIDANGRFITLIDCEISVMEYTQLIFADNRVEFHQLPYHINDSWDWEEWRAHHWAEWGDEAFGIPGIIDSWLYNSPTIFRTDIPISPLHSFDALGAVLLLYMRD